MTGVKILVFSSSATVYGDPQYLPLDEQHPLSATNPYGRSKLHIEAMLSDVAHSDAAWRIACLRSSRWGGLGSGRQGKPISHDRFRSSWSTSGER